MRGVSSVGSIGGRVWPMVEGCGVGHVQYESHATPDTSHSRAVVPNTNTTFVFTTIRSDINTTTQTPSQFLVYNNEQ